MKALKMNPHGVSGVGQPTLRERIGCQQIAEFIMSAGLRHPDKQRNPNANNHSQKTNQGD